MNCPPYNFYLVMTDGRCYRNRRDDKERFTTGIVKRTSFLGEGLDNIVCIQKLTERRSGILRPMIGMEDQSVGNISALICFMEGSDNQGGIVFGG